MVLVWRTLFYCNHIYHMHYDFFLLKGLERLVDQFIRDMCIPRIFDRRFPPNLWSSAPHCSNRVSMLLSWGQTRFFSQKFLFAYFPIPLCWFLTFWSSCSLFMLPRITSLICSGANLTELLRIVFLFDLLWYYLANYEIFFKMHNL